MNELIKTLKDFYKENSHMLNVAFGAVIFLVVLLIRNKLSKAVLGVIARISYKDEAKRNPFVEALKKPLSMLFVLCGLFGALMLNVQSAAIVKGFKILTILIICWGITNFVSNMFSSSLSENKDSDDRINLTAVNFISKLFKILIIALAVMMVISELGYNINGLITGLGVGGLAISLAAQDAVSNLISGFIIVFDKPFKVGDFVQTKEIMGTVTEVSMRTTKIRTLDDSLVTVPNSKLTQDAIVNISKIEKRLIDTEIGLIYSTDNELINKCKNDIVQYLKNNELIVPAPIRVEVTKLDDFSINLGVFCYTIKTDIHEFYAVLSDVNLNIKDIVERNGAEFAFPTNSIYIENQK